MVEAFASEGKEKSFSKTALKREYKPLGIISDQQRRREEALQRQKLARRDLQLHARNLAHRLTSAESHALEFSSNGLDTDTHLGAYRLNEIGANEDVEMQASRAIEYLRLVDTQGVSKPEKKDAVKIVHEWSDQQLMLPEWMIDIPPRLVDDWYVMPRPDGKRCLVISANGTTVSRLKNGFMLHKFFSSLPNGSRSRQVSTGNHIYCILDCIFSEESQTYYIIDMMAWNGVPLYDCTTEFRFFWIGSKLAETGVCDAQPKYQKYPFRTVPISNCDSSGLQRSYSAPMDFKRDGLLFYNKHAHYTLGVTPLVLLWKDEKCCQYFIDTDKNGNVPANQQIVLKLEENGFLCTCDVPPVKLIHISSLTFHDVKMNFKPGTLFRLSIRNAGVQFENKKHQPPSSLPPSLSPFSALFDYNFEEIANPKRGGADSLSKILFQHNARDNPLRFEIILEHVLNHPWNSNTSMRIG